MNWKKASVWLGLLSSLTLLFACGKKEKEVRFIPSEKMYADYDQVDLNEEETEESKTSETTHSSPPVQEEMNEETLLSFVRKVGDVYGNFDDLQTRNERMSELLSKECAEKNGFTQKNNLQKVEGKGSVEHIMKDMKEKNTYWLFLTLSFNKIHSQGFLYLKVEKDKVVEMKSYTNVKEN
jgi:hypothetical protein